MKNKIVTFSFDDGVCYDKRLVEIFNKYNLKCTFNINTGIQDDSHTFDRGGFPIEVHRMTPDEMREVYKGHEIATHTLTHPWLTKCPDDVLNYEIQKDIENIQTIFGVKGVPCLAYPYGDYDERVFNALRRNGVKFARATKPTKGFDVPENLLAYHPTEHYRDPNILDIINEFLNSKSDKKQVLCIWGHAYELEGYNEWDKFVKICEAVSNKDGVEYLTNGEAFLNDDSGVYR